MRALCLHSPRVKGVWKLCLSPGPQVPLSLPDNQAAIQGEEPPDSRGEDSPVARKHVFGAPMKASQWVRGPERRQTGQQPVCSHQGERPGLGSLPRGQVTFKPSPALMEAEWEGRAGRLATRTPDGDH